MADGMFRLEDKVALVTGAASGIGRAIALAYAGQGARVWIGDIDDTKGKGVAREIAASSGRGHYLPLDVTSGSGVTEVFDTIVREEGRLDILVNNAGISAVGTVLAVEEEEWHRVMDVNIKGVYLCSQAAVRQMIDQEPQGGVIINMGSIASMIGLKDRFLYSATKGAVIEMTRCIATDHVKSRIRCNCICPARIHTPFVDDYLDRHYPDNREEMFRRLSEYQPVGRMGTPEEVAALAVYLASDEAAFVTGAAYLIDGGVTASR
jgi:NAD(P)-dependent dehydrogenase (short-subunit alcohol dehydrogenase family)